MKIGKNRCLVFLSGLFLLYDVLLLCKLLCVINQARAKGRVGRPQTSESPPPPPPASNFIAGRPKGALLFGFFGDFRCGALLFMVILVIYKYKNR